MDSLPSSCAREVSADIREACGDNPYGDCVWVHERAEINTCVGCPIGDNDSHRAQKPRGCAPALASLLTLSSVCPRPSSPARVCSVCVTEVPQSKDPPTAPLERTSNGGEGQASQNPGPSQWPSGWGLRGKKTPKRWEVPRGW